MQTAETAPRHLLYKVAWDKCDRETEVVTSRSEVQSCKYYLAGRAAEEAEENRFCLKPDIGLLLTPLVLFYIFPIDSKSHQKSKTNNALRAVQDEKENYADNDVSVHTAER